MSTYNIPETPGQQTGGTGLSSIEEATRPPARADPLRRPAPKAQPEESICPTPVPARCAWRRRSRHVARVIGVCKYVGAHNLERLTDEALLVLVTDGATSVHRSDWLYSCYEPSGRTSGGGTLAAVRNVADDPRLAKPGILRIVDVVRTGCMAVDRCGRPSCEFVPTLGAASVGPPTRRQYRMARPPALKLSEVLAEVRMSPLAFYRLRARNQAPRMIKLPNGELRCRRSDLDAWWQACERDTPEWR